MLKEALRGVSGGVWALGDSLVCMGVRKLCKLGLGGI